MWKLDDILKALGTGSIIWLPINSQQTCSALWTSQLSPFQSVESPSCLTPSPSTWYPAANNPNIFFTSKIYLKSVYLCPNPTTVLLTTSYMSIADLSASLPWSHHPTPSHYSNLLNTWIMFLSGWKPLSVTSPLHLVDTTLLADIKWLVT